MYLIKIKVGCQLCGLHFCDVCFNQGAETAESALWTGFLSSIRESGRSNLLSDIPYQMQTL